MTVADIAGKRSAMPQARTAWFREVLKKYDRVAIVGPPHAGKTTLSRWGDGRQVIHTDDYKDRYGWSEASQQIKDDAIAPRLIIEGVRTPHALRKGTRVDVVVCLKDPVVELSDGQKRMAKACDTVLNEWRAANPDVPVLIAPPIAKDEDDADESRDGDA